MSHGPGGMVVVYRSSPSHGAKIARSVSLHLHASIPFTCGCIFGNEHVAGVCIVTGSNLAFNSLTLSLVVPGACSLKVANIGKCSDSPSCKTYGIVARGISPFHYSFTQL